jgi:hypothetical protein
MKKMLRALNAMYRVDTWQLSFLAQLIGLGGMNLKGGTGLASLMT